MLVIYPISYTAQNSLTYSFRQPVPIRYNCPELPPGFLLNDTDSWNCNLCGSDSAFFAPYERGDVIPFQTQFADNFNVPESVLSAGFLTTTSTDNYIKVELQDCCGVTIYDEIDLFCEVFWVGYSVKTGSLQTWFVNTGLFPTNLDCFRLKITYYRNPSAPVIERVIYTEYYKEVADCGSFTDTALIESTYADFDCNGNYYNTVSNFLGNQNNAYYNSMRIHGNVEFFGDSESVTENDRNIVISKDITENYGIISGVVPPYSVKRLAQTVRGNAVTVDGIQYQNFTYDAKPDDSRMFLLDLNFVKKCSLNNKSCE
jgi:hypothetical protein